MLESKTGVFFIAGLGFFALAFLSNAVVPIMMYRHLPEQSVEQLLENNGNLRYQFEDLARRYPDSFKPHIGRRPRMRRAREVAEHQMCQKHFDTGGRSMWAKVAGTAIASSFGQCRTRIGGGVRFPRPRNIRTSCNGPSCSEPGGLVRISAGKGDGAPTTGTQFTSSSRPWFRRVHPCRNTPGFSRALPIKPNDQRARTLDLSSMARLVARELSLLRRLSAVGRFQPGSQAKGVQQ